MYSVIVFYVVARPKVEAISLVQGNRFGLGFAGLKPPAQFMEALRADGRVRFSGLPCTEAGHWSAELLAINFLAIQAI